MIAELVLQSPNRRGLPLRLASRLAGFHAGIMERYRRATWAMVGYTILVIVWGAIVRGTHSGAGCGDHWPLCNGDVVPLSPNLETAIEFGHRLMSGLALLFCIALVVGARRVFPKGHGARWSAVVALVFMVLESLIGAALVLLKLVADNPAEARGYWAAAHVVNTFLLLGAMTLHAHRASARKEVLFSKEPVLVATLLTLLLVAATGAIAALGDTLFPADDLVSAVTADFDRSSHLFVRLRIFHPVVALIAAALALTVGVRSTARASRVGHPIIVLVSLQVGLGFLNIALLAPLWLQLVHLAVADILWVALVYSGFEPRTIAL